jgi:nicotinate phosphoribosyltransferase
MFSKAANPSILPVNFPVQEWEPTQTNRRETLLLSLPEFSAPYTDKYFLRSKEILERDNLNPWVLAQVMIRKGPGQVGGVDEAIAIFKKYSAIREHGGSIYALSDGDQYSGGETLLHIYAPIQDIIDLETMYLGVLSSETTRANTGVKNINLAEVTRRMSEVVRAADGRPVMYFGARHWRYDEDAAISLAAFEGGATSCSTDVGAAWLNQKGVGTVPHVLENIYAWKYKDKNKAVVEAMKAFDEYIDREVPRVALIDYDNHEISRAIETANALEAQGSKLHAVRVDTCGENLAQDAVPFFSSPLLAMWNDKGVQVPDTTNPDARYWYGNGVTVTGVYALRRALDRAGHSDVQIILSSGFGDAEKVRAFVRAEKVLGVKLFDGLGVGGVFDSWSAKMDIVKVGESVDSMEEISKTGRGFRENPRLKRVM